MSAQVNDVFVYDNKKYSISAIENQEMFFDITDVGISPKPCSSACWRGYIAVFSIDGENRLVLKELNTNSKDEQLPEINGVKPEFLKLTEKNVDALIKKSGYTLLLGGTVIYTEVNLPIRYSGKLLITKGFIDDYYIHMGYQSSYAYNEVIELTFKDGICTNAEDVSELAKQKRKKHRPQKQFMGFRNSENWINEMFDLSYNSKRV
ncbi:MAG: hypothetical protein LBI03_02340 [Clostridiales bacterium]|jgi:hypothetical protein|nr:hypothetical protein [Clostridiales bacterium]